MQNPVALITGSAKRIGACIAHALHQNSHNVVIHYRHSQQDAEALCQQLNAQREDSAIVVQADLNEYADYKRLVNTAVQQWGQLNTLINNASEYFPNTVGDSHLEEWDRLFNSNVRGAFFISNYAAKHLQETSGNIINIIDVNGQQPLKGYSIYSMAKAALTMMTKSLARELGPAIKVNGIAPGITMWGDHDDILSDEHKQELLDRTILKKLADPSDITKAVLFLLKQNSITGQIINVDAGRVL